MISCHLDLACENSGGAFVIVMMKNFIISFPFEMGYFFYAPFVFYRMNVEVIIQIRFARLAMKLNQVLACIP